MMTDQNYSRADSFDPHNRQATSIDRWREWIDDVLSSLFPENPTRATVTKVLVLSAVVGLVLSILFLMIVRPTYTATMVISPTQEQFSSTPSSQLDRNALSLLGGGGLLSGPRVITPYDAFLKVMQSHEVAEKLYKDPVVREGLFPGAWDSASKSFRNEYSVKSFVMGGLYRLIGRKYPLAPTADTIQTILQNKVSATMVDRGPMYIVTFSDRDRGFAIEFLRRTFVYADATVKGSNYANVLNRIQQLKQRMNALDVMEYRSKFAELMMDQEKQLMLLQGNGHFAASIVVEPSAPGTPDNPRVFSTIILFIVLFVIFGASVLVFGYRDIVVARLRPGHGRAPD